MSNYTKATNFLAKDTLPVGDANKKVKGSELDTEFNAISNAVATKADKNDPTFTGVPAAPTATAGTNTTQIATTAFVTTALTNDKASPAFTGTPTAPTAATTTDTTQIATTAFVQQEINAIPAVDLSSLHPVGSIYINASNSTNPGTLFGFGTWVAFGAGRVLVGLDSSDTDFDTAEETGGAKTHTLTVDEIPPHTHTVPNSGAQNNSFDSGTFVGNDVEGTSGSTGGGDAHNNLQPYITVYMWKRTA